jgi:protein phosphatase PTC7
VQDSPFGENLLPIHPLDVLNDAWSVTGMDKDIAGSCTFCIAMLDKNLNQISYSNIGDGGLMVVRHIDSETAGYMRDRHLPRHMRTNDLKIAYLSQQQLRSFNLPYQLGQNGTQAAFKGSFETPSDADTASIPVLAGDIIILATDGLFDNLELSEIVEEISLWEKTDTGTSTQVQTASLEQLAQRLVKKARMFSLDKHRDSPFAILAKENDIMWGGGMPDDTSIIVGKVVPLQ